MSQPTIANPQAYRQLQFQGGHILQAREVQSIQSLIGDEAANNTYMLGALFPEGAPLNVTPTIHAGSGNATVTLTKTNSSQPMLVYVNGRFEQIDAGGPVSVTYTQATNGTNVTMYANWILWRVTADGNRGSIRDTTLVDSDTQESVAEVGQLQLSFGPDASGTVPAQTQSVYTIFNQNTAPLPMLTFQWQSGSLVWTGSTSIRPSMLGTPVKPGVVTTTTATTQVVSTDDPRNSNTRNPNAGSVNSAIVSGVTPTGADAGLNYRDQNNVVQAYSAAGVQIVDTAGGINSNRIWNSAWKTTLDKCLGFVGTQLTSIWGTLQSYGTRIFALENKPTVDYSWHVGQTLGRSGSLVTTHPPVINNNDPATVYPGFQVIGGLPGQGMFDIVRSDGATLNSRFWCDGNYSVLNPDYQHRVNQFGFDFHSYVEMCDQLIPWLNHGWGATMRLDSGYFILRIQQVGGGNIEIGFGSGTLFSGANIPLPGGFSYSQMASHVSAYFTRSNSSNNSSAMTTHSITVSNGNVSMFNAGTDGRQWPENGSASSQVLSWIAVIWRIF